MDIKEKLYLELNVKLVLKKAIAQFRLLNYYNSKLILSNKNLRVLRNLHCTTYNMERKNFIHWVFDCPDIDDL